MAIDRKYIPARDPLDATNILAMDLQSAYARFVTEEGWCDCNLELGEPKSVGSVHYTFKSRLAKTEVETEGTHKKIGVFEIDRSPEAQGHTDYSEIETTDVDEITRFDKTLLMVPKVHAELQNVREQVAGINGAIEMIAATNNNVAALCQSGIPIQSQFNMLQTTVARQGESIHLMQQSMLKIIENMGKIIDKMGIQ
jgi:hypothetical protein